MSSPSKSFVLPDLISLLPYKSSFNPHYERASTSSSAWVNGYKILPDRKRALFEQGCSEILCGYAYSYAGYEELRATMDLVNILFTVDLVSDDQNGKDAYKTGRVLLNALRDPDWHDGSALAQMTKDFRKRLLQFDVPTCYRRLLKHCEEYVNAVAVEAELRERDEVLDPESYIVLRRENSAVRCCFGMFGFTLGLDLPDEIFDHPAMMRLHLAAVDMVCWSNDLYSYNMEQAMGHTGNNILTVLMKAHQYDIQAAADHVGTHFKQLVESFEADKARLPSWGPELDAVVSKHVMALETWVVGNFEWSFAIQRYFGVQKEEVKRTLVVELYPKDEEHDD